MPTLYPPTPATVLRSQRLRSLLRWVLTEGDHVVLRKIKKQQQVECSGSRV